MTNDLKKRKITFRDVWSALTPDHWETGRTWLGYTLFFGLLPTTLAIIGEIIVPSHNMKLTDFLIHGEFMIYAATLTATSTRLITKDVPGAEPFVRRQLFNLVSLAIVIPSATGYAIIKHQNFSNSPNAIINVTGIVWFSILMLVAGILISFVVFVLDAQRTAPAAAAQFANELRQAEQRLGADFEKLQGDK